MAIGSRIKQRLSDLGLERKDLLAKVPNLTPQALSNLIVRDSKRSEWDEAIAAALDVPVTWLVYDQPLVVTAHKGAGKSIDTADLTATAKKDGKQAVFILEAKTKSSTVIDELIQVARNMTEEGQSVLLGRAQEMLYRYQKPKANLSS